jgi:Domain of unknown function (DUF3427).
MKRLVLYQDYTRKDVHDIFEPDSHFTSQSGKWGISGIVQIADRKGDFVLFVTFGKKQGTHVFDEGVTELGVLSWQSQPKQDFTSRTVQRLMAHDDAINSIYLFLRTDEKRPYTYLGRLRYRAHDLSREHPVHFQWQILDWDVDKVPREKMGLTFLPDDSIGQLSVAERKPGLTLIGPPSVAPRKGVPTRTFQTRRTPDRSAIDDQNTELGRAGERLVLQYESAQLRAMGFDELATRVRHISEIEGDGAGFDIHSFEPSGEPKYIEVKTTKGAARTPFYLSSNELAFAKSKGSQFYLYRVCEYFDSPPSGKVYVTRGDPTQVFHLTPVQFRAAR